MGKEATPRQLAILKFIMEFSCRQGYPPSIAEMMPHFGIGSIRGITVHLDSLERKGLIQRVFGISRGIKITPGGYNALGGKRMELPKGVQYFVLLRGQLAILTIHAPNVPPMHRLWEVISQPGD